MRLRLSPGTVARGLRNQLYTPGRDLRLPYEIELDPIDYALGTTLAAATLVIAQDFGLNPLLSKQISPALSAAGQITDDGGTDGVASLFFAIVGSELLPYRALGPLVFEVIVTDSRGLQGSLDMGSLVPTVSTAGAPVDHVLITPNPFTASFPATQQLVATAYDVDSNVLTGRTVQWSSSDETIALVDPNGVVSVIAGGGAIITATVEGKSGTSTGTFIVPAALTLKLDANFLNEAEREQPFLYLSDFPRGQGDGFENYLPQHVGSGLWVANRVAYPRNADTVAYCGKNSSIAMPNDAGHDRKNCTVTAVAGSIPNTTGWLVTVADGWEGFESWVFAVFRSRTFEPTVGIDDQDKLTYKRSMAVRVRSDPAHPEDLGKPFVVQLVANIDLVQNKVVYKSVAPNPVLTALPQPFALTFDSYADFANPDISWICVGFAPNGAKHFIVEPYSNDEFQAVGPSQEWLRPAPMHDELGWQSTFEGVNIWRPNSNDPVLYGGAVKVGASAVDAPDAATQWGGRKMNRYTLPTSGGFTTDANYQLESISDVSPSNVPTTAAYLQAYLVAAPGGALPAAGILKAYFRMNAGPRYGPISLVPDTADVMISKTTGGRRYRARVPVNLLNEGRLTGKPEIENSGPQIDLLASEFVCVSENERQIGLGSHMLVGKPCVNAYAYNDAAYIKIPNIAAQLSTLHGIVFIRSAANSPLNALPDGGGSRSEFQSGPGGSADFSLDAAQYPPNTVQGRAGPMLNFNMQRGGQDQFGNPVNFADYIGWDVSLIWPGPVDGTVFPEFVASDKWIAWWHDAGGHMHVVFGIGHGTGTGITWLQNGDTFLGAAVTMSTRDATQGKTAWDFSTAIGTDAFHMGIAADRDIIRMLMGWVQGIALGNTVPANTIAADLQASMEYHTFRRHGARKDFRIPRVA